MSITSLLLTLAIFFPLLCSPFFFLLEKVCKRYMGWIGSVIPLISALLVYFTVFSRDGEIRQVLTIAPYFSPLNLHISFLVDGLSLFFAFLVTLIGILVFIYANDYMLEEEESGGGLGEFYAVLCAFITCMLGTVFANDLLLQFTFWELTGVCSFLLIGYHYHLSKTVQAAKGAFLLTSFTDLGLFAGLLVLGFAVNTFSWGEILAFEGQGISIPVKNTAFLLIFMGILGKSAQIPFHFWLPSAMCAPTPVSSYLHAATMVKLGIFLTARIYPFFVDLDIWFPVITILCFSTMILGGIFSLLSHDLKAILAWATVSQLGFFIGFYGLGNIEGVSYDFLHIFNHALYKGALFMLVGVIYHATKERDVRRLGGLLPVLPLTGTAFFIACASMAGIPGTTGFLSKELLITELVFTQGRTFFSAVFATVALGSLFKVALAIRLFFHLFVRESKNASYHVLKKPSLSLQLSPLILASAALVFGVWPGGITKLLPYFHVSGLHSLSNGHEGLFPGGIQGILASLVIIFAGTLLFLLAERVNWGWRGIPHLLNFNRYFQRSQFLLIKWSQTLTHFIEPKKIEHAQAFVFLSFSTLLFLTLPLNSTTFFLTHDHDIIRFFVSCMLILCCFGVVLLKDLISQLISLSISGFLVSLLFVLFKAPDLAMTQILIEVVTLFLLLFFLSETVKIQKENKKTFLPLFASIAVGCASFALCSTLYSFEIPHIGTYFSKNSLLLSGAANSVNSIVINFRGFDTLGESAVLIIACLGIVGLLNTRCRYPEMARQLSSSSLFPSLALSKEIGHVSKSLVLANYTKPLFFVVNLVAIYLLVRGHNLPGGGFTAGVCTAISFILIGISMEWGRVLRIILVEPLEVASWGLAFIAVTASLPLFFGKPFLFHPKWHLKIAGMIDLSSQLIFDIGIYLLVGGVLAVILFVFKKRLSMKDIITSRSIKKVR